MPQKGDLVQIKVGPTILSKIGLVIKLDDCGLWVWVKWPDKSQWESPNFLKVIEC
jgi:hypothetical protein